MRRIAMCLTVVSFALSSCTKINFAEYWKHPGQLRFCNIAAWTDSPGDESSETRTNVFTYDEHGNPLSVIPDQHGTGNGSHFFSYDTQERLVSYEYEFVKTKVFHYQENKSRADSATVTDAFGREFSEVYTYDTKGRIIKSVLTFVSSPFEEDAFPPETRDYVYLNDDLNSMIVNGVQQNPDVTYSDKPSVFMTNKVWKFVNQNYSKHAVNAVASTNRIGLPASFGEDEYEFPFLDIQAPGSTIKYQCE
ncbi:MAG: hypothetical protein JNK79_12095 [Chitinophagaceae bacterium]|nr:hypothetical protein [Chitinophagaceae bacterium]